MLGMYYFRHPGVDSSNKLQRRGRETINMYIINKIISGMLHYDKNNNVYSAKLQVRPKYRPGRAA